MQIILSHFMKVKLSVPSKKKNAKYIEQAVQIKNYDATEEQRKKLFSKITRTNYKLMKENIADLSTDDTVCSSTNFLQFLNNFEQDEIFWIDSINQTLEE